MTFSLDEHTDFVSDLCAQPERHMLLSTGGDGCLCAWDMRKGVLQVASEQIEDELLSLVVMKVRAVTRPGTLSILYPS